MALSARVIEQAAFSLDLAALIAYADSRGYATAVGEVERTPLQQAEYVRTGRSKTFDSKHLKRMAADCHFYDKTTGKYLATEAEIAPLGKFWESLNPKNRWGGNFRSLCDAPHFERNA